MTTGNTKHSSPSNRGLRAQLALAGAAALAGSSAHAQIVTFNVNENVGFAPGDFPAFTTALPGANQLTISARETFFGTTSNAVQRQLRINAPNGNAYVKGTLINGTIAPVMSPAGRKWSTINGATVGTAAFRLAQRATMTPEGYSTFPPAYFAFKFTDSLNNQLDYGYIEASLTNASYTNMTLEVISYSYDETGAQILTGATSVPEPGATVALAALSALTLGAVGVRRLKALQVAT